VADDFNIADLFSLKGRIALVTGGCGGLGRAVAEGYLRAGATVAVADANAEKVPAVANTLGTFGTVAGLVCDVTDHAAVERTVAEVEKRFGRIDILCNAAGVAPRTPATDLPEAEFQRVWEINVKGTWLTSQTVGKGMIARGQGGKIINIGSVRGFAGHPLGYVAYGTSKGAVHMFTRQLGTEWAKYRINVNCLAPSVLNTPLASYILDNPPIKELFLSRIPFNKIAEPGELMGAAIFLASPAADFITGQILSVDGGATAG
jgi:gluconate 5-dehydrogenase